MASVGATRGAILWRDRDERDAKALVVERDEITPVTLKKLAAASEDCARSFTTWPRAAPLRATSSAT